MLHALGKQDILEFGRARLSYLDSVKECMDDAGGTDIAPVSIKASIHVDLLWSLVDLQEFGDDVQDVRDVTESMLDNWLGKHTQKSKVPSIDELKREVSTLRMDEYEADPEQRVIKLFAAYATLLRHKSMNILPKREPEMCIKHILPLLRPRVLQTRIRKDLELERKDLLQNFRLFYLRVIQRAIACDDFVTIASEKALMTPPQPGKPSPRQDTRPPTVAAHANPTGGQPGPSTGKPGAATLQAGARSQASQTETVDPPRIFCLNHTCNGNHFIRQCDKSPDELKDTLTAAYREVSKRRMQNGESKRDAGIAAAKEVRRRKIGSPSVRSNALALAPVARECLVVTTLGDSLQGQALLDTGSDENTISRKISADPSLRSATRERLDQAIEVTLTGTEHRACATERLQTSVLLHLETGPLLLRNVWFLILDIDYNEFIVGRPLPQELGVDVVKQLDEAREWAHDVDFSHVKGNPNESRLSRAISMPDVADPFEPDMPEAPFGADDPSGLANEIQAMLARASTDCSETLADDLSNIVTQFFAAFALKIGDRPPARFEPMKIDLKDGIEPVRARARPLSADKRAFVRNQVQSMIQSKLVYRNTTSNWAHPVHVVPKPGAAKFRFTVDLREGNARQKTVAWPMPHLESIMQDLAGKSCFATFDLSQG